MVTRIVSAAALVMSLAGVAAAQSNSELAQARRLFQEGLQHAESEQWVPALEAFRASHTLVPRTSTQINLCSTLIRLGRLLEAERELNTLLRDGDLSEAERTQAGRLLDRAREGIRTLQIELAPREARLLLDGQVVDERGGRVRVDPGTHQLEARLEGYRPLRRELGPEESSIAMTLAPLPANLRVHSSVAEAEIRIDGEVRGLGNVDLELRPSTYEVEVAAEEHDLFEQEVTLAPGQRIVLEAPLSESGKAYQNPWLWTIIGVAVLGAGVAVGVALYEGPQPDYYGGSADDVLQPR